MLRDRPTGDVIVILLASTICVGLVGIVLVVAITELLDPDTDSSPVLSSVTQILATLLSLVAGYLAGRTTARGGEK